MSNARVVTSDDYFVNPLTGRYITTSGRVYRNLVKQGFIVPKKYTIDNPCDKSHQIWPDDDEELIQIKDNDETPEEKNEEEKKEEKEEEKEVEEKDDDDVEKEQKYDTPEIEESDYSKEIASAAQLVMSKYKSELAIIKDDESLLAEIQRLIETELLSS